MIRFWEGYKGWFDMRHCWGGEDRLLRDCPFCADMRWFARALAGLFMTITRWNQ